MAIQRNTYPIIPTGLAKEKTHNGVPVPQPSVEHTLTTCDQCGIDGWIGPAQLMALTFNGGSKICYWCLGAEQDAGANFTIKGMLDRTADTKPRRT